MVAIDEDQGLSGQNTEHPGFQRLLEAISRGQVGAVFCLKVSRISRRSSAWHGLIEICAWQDTLIIEEENIYDPNISDDRFHLGIRGLMGENELATLRKRMHKSIVEKARRGELRFHPPTGLLCDKKGTFRAHLRVGGGADLGGLHSVLLEQIRRFGAVLGLKVVLRKPPRSRAVVLPQVLHAPEPSVWTQTIKSKGQYDCSFANSSASETPLP